MEKNNSNFKSWKCKVDEFRGYMRGKVEALEKLIENHCKGAESRRLEHSKELKSINTKIGTIEQYIAGRQAVQKIKSSLWGALGGLIVFIIANFAKKILGL